MNGEVQNIPLDQIDRNPNQPRQSFPPDHIARLAASIKARGLLQPITVRPVGDRYMIVAGECRWLAHKEIGAETIRAIVKPMGEQEMQLLAIVENLQRRDMNPMEEARAFKTLTDGGFSMQQIVDELGLKTTSIVRQRLELLELQPEIQRLVETGNLSVIMAWGVAQAPPQYQPKLIREINNGTLRTAEQVKQAGWALRDAAAQPDCFADAPKCAKADAQAISRLEGKIETIASLVQTGFKNGECVAAQRVSVGRVRTMADKLTLIRKHILQMEHALRCVAMQTEILLEPASTLHGSTNGWRSK